MDYLIEKFNNTRQKDEFLSNILGIDCYKIVDPSLYSCHFALMDNNSFEYVRLTPNQIGLVNCFVECDFSLICQEFEFVKDVSKFDYVEQNNNYTVQTCFVADQKQTDSVINKFAFTFKNDRFRLDSKLEGKAFDIKRQWIKNTFDRKRACFLFFALNDKKEPVGFVSAVRSGNRKYRIDLISVLREHRYRGVARKLIDVLSLCNNIDKIVACTQANNEAAVKMYKRLGFEINQVYTVLHRIRFL